MLKSFKRGYELLEQTPEDQLEDDAKWIRDALRETKSKTIDENKDTIEVSFNNPVTGENFTQQEGIPAEGLVQFMRKRVEALPADSKDREEIQKASVILQRSSESYYILHSMNESSYVGRVNQEAHLISQDSRATGTPDGDWYKALDILTGRRELVLPKAPKKKSPIDPPPGSDLPPSDSEDLPPQDEDLPPQDDGITPVPIPEDDGITPPPNHDTPPAPEDDGITLPPIKDGDNGPEPDEDSSVPDSSSGEEDASAELPSHTIRGVNRSSDVIKNANEQAEELLQQEMRRGSIFNPLNWGRKTGLRIMEDHFRQKISTHLQNLSRENDNSYVNLNLVRSSLKIGDLGGGLKNLDVNTQGNQSDSIEAGRATLEGISRGEHLPNRPKYQEAQGELKQAMLEQIIRPVINGEITNEHQVQEILRTFVSEHQNDPQITELFGRDSNQYGRLADFFATDLLEVGEAMKRDIAAHKFSIDQLDRVVKIQLANTSWASETQPNFTMVDKAIRWAESHRLTGTLINPATISAAFSIGTFALIKAPGMGSRYLWAVPGVGLAAGAIFAGLRRNYDLKVDRASHQAERTYNARQIPEIAKRRIAIERYQYDIASKNNLINGGGQELLTGTDRLSMAELISRDLSEGQTTNREALARRKAEILTRLDFSTENRVDLISFDSKTQVQQGRLSLIEEVIKADEALLEGGMSKEEVDEMTSRFSGEWNARFTQNVQQQDRAFAIFRLRNAAGAAAFGGVAGLGGGFALKEVMESTGFNPLGFAVEKTGNSVSKFKDFFHKGGQTQVGDYKLEIGSDHSINIIDAKDNSIGTASLQENGNILARADTTPPQVLEHFKDQGFEVNNGPDIQNTLFDQQPGTSIFLANSIQVLDFNAPNERSWQLRYDLDMAAFGVPGLSFMSRYVSGDHIDDSHYDGGPNGAYGRYGDDGKRWERDIEARYVVQSGKARDLSVRVRQASVRSTAQVARADTTDNNEVRVIIEYPLSIF